MRVNRSAFAAAMAENNLAKELFNLRWSAMRSGLIVSACGTAALLGWAAFEPGLFEEALFASAVWTGMSLLGHTTGTTRRGRYRKVASGLEGEAFVFQVLSTIPGAIVRNQVLLPNERSRTGHTEADFILIGKKALYLVETKNNAGTIVASEKEDRWPVRTPGGKVVDMRNPVRQVNIQAKVLRDRLAEKGLTPLIQPTVGFSNRRAALKVKGQTSVPVFTYPLDSLTRRVMDYETRLAHKPDLDQDLLQQVLNDLHAEALRVAKPIEG